MASEDPSSTHARSRGNRTPVTKLDRAGLYFLTHSIQVYFRRATLVERSKEGKEAAEIPSRNRRSHGFV